MTSGTIGRREAKETASGACVITVFAAILIAFCIFPPAILAASETQSHSNSAPPGALIIGLICWLARKKPIGGWLLFFFIQLYAGLAVAIVLLFAVSLRNYNPALWQSTNHYLLFLLSSLPTQLLLCVQAVIGTFLLRTRDWKWVQILRKILIADAVGVAVSFAIDSSYFKDDLVFDFFAAVWPVIWLPYFYVSSRVKRVFQTKDWEITLPPSSTAPTLAPVPARVESVAVVQAKSNEINKEASADAFTNERSGKVASPKPPAPDMRPADSNQLRATQRSDSPRLRRTLLFAGAFALLAMVFVPMPMHERGYNAGGGYRFVFDQSNTGVALFQLLVNVAFAAGVGAIAAQLTKRTLRIIAVCLAGCLVVGGGIGFIIYSENRASSDEENAAYSLQNYPADAYAAEKFRNAAVNWRFALQFDKANRADANAVAAEKQRKLAQSRIQFRNEWQANARKVAAAHPELTDRRSSEWQCMQWILDHNPTYSQQLNGFELAYAEMMTVDRYQKGKVNVFDLVDSATEPKSYISKDPNAGLQPPPQKHQQQPAIDLSGLPDQVKSQQPQQQQPTSFVRMSGNDTLNVRADADANSVIVATLRSGDRVVLQPERTVNTAKGVRVTWQKITTQSGQSGWVNAEYLSPGE